MAHIYGENIVGTSTVMAQREALCKVGGFDVTLKSASDWDLWLKLASLGPVAALNQVSMDYLMRPGSISSKRLLRLQAMETIMARHQSRVAQVNPKAVDLAESRLKTGYAEYYQIVGLLSRALFYHLYAFIQAPSWRVGRAALANIKGMVCSVASLRREK
ncbi:hypothetical protein ACQZV8_15660 [Magnetococcales bacterium HHB-1]